MTTATPTRTTPRKKMDFYSIWLTPRVGNVNQILRSDWLPERARMLGTTPESHIINPLLTKFVRSRWLNDNLVLFSEFMGLDSVSVHKHTKIFSHVDLTLGQ